MVAGGWAEYSRSPSIQQQFSSIKRTSRTYQVNRKSSERGMPTLMTCSKPTSSGSFQCMYSNLNVSVRSHRPISKSEPSQPIADTHLSRLYLQVHSFSHHTKLMAKVEGWNVDQLCQLNSLLLVTQCDSSVIGAQLLPVIWVSRQTYLHSPCSSLCINTTLA